VSDTLPQVSRALLDVFGPLASALGDSGLASGLFAELGVEVTLDEQALAALRSAAPGLQRAASELGPITERFESTGSISAADAIAVAEIALAVRRDVEALSSGGASGSLARLPPPLDTPATWIDLAPQLLGGAVAAWLDSSLPALGIPLRFGGVVREWYDANGRRHRRVFWSALGDLLADPVAALGAAVGWGDDLDVEALTASLRDAAQLAGLTLDWAIRPSRVVDDRFPSGIPEWLWPCTIRARRSPASSSVVLGTPALGILPIPATVNGPIRGVALLDASSLELGSQLALAPPWTLTLTGAARGDDLVIELLPGVPATVNGSGRVDAGLLLRGAPDEPWILLGADTGLRLTLAGVEVEGRVTAGTGAVETTLRLSATGSGLSLVMPAGSGDNFIAATLVDEIDVGAAFDLSWSSSSGFSLNGSLGLAITIPIARQLGPLLLEQLDVSLTLGETSSLELRLTLDVSIGPFQAKVAGVGLSVDLHTSPDGSGVVGPFDITLGVLPPHRVGFVIDIPSARGGGFVDIDPDRGRYAGALSLDIVSVGVDAIVVIDTQLPGDPEGWALFASLAASFPGIPLGFGFTLNGVGGLLALNRTLDAEALAAALRAGVIDALLFPEDPVRDSAELIAQIDEYFPIMNGNTVVGPVIEIGWGSPTLITAQLGVVISLPDGLIAVMGSIEALLPTPSAALITLHMDSLGVIDLGAGTFSLTASLYDSRLLESIDLGGDMAMYLQIAEQPYFLLSVGGYHPGFDPPAIVPAAMHDLRRMQASIVIGASVSIAIEAYLAITSNSVQFGSSVNVIAAVELWPTTYTARGWFGFDVMLVFSPFKIVAAMSAGVGIYAGNKELMGVQLDLLLEGPKPWYATGSASFKFFGLKVNFELDVGSRATGEPKPLAHPRADVLAALRSPSCWSETAPLGVVAGITYVAATAEGDIVWVRPDHSLTVRQSVAPLNRTLEVVGQALPAPDEERMTVVSAGFLTGPAVEWSLADDWFAPAQFEVLHGTDKLTRASFERMTAGVTFGAPATAIAEGEGITTSVSTGYESAEARAKVKWQVDPSADPLADSVRSGAAGVGLRHVAARAVTPMFVISPTTYSLARSVDGTRAAEVSSDSGLSMDGVSQYDAQRARRAAIAEDERDATRIVVVAASAVLEAAS
jgi:hypothetical protein